MTQFSETIPIIDLKEISGSMLNQNFGDASERWGCFRLINHGVPQNLMSEMKKTFRYFFISPYKVKMRNTNVLQGCGYKSQNKINLFCESLGFYDMTSYEDVNTICDQLDASADQRFRFIILS